MDSGVRLLAWLRSRGMSQAELASKVGVSRAAVTAWVKPASDEAHRDPTRKNLLAIIAALGLTTEAEYYGDIPDPQPKEAAA
jgi:transcriptional regulator with XRE-family HTH domain